jgi:N-acetylmuramoyl-L-alanine amidase
MDDGQQLPPDRHRPLLHYISVACLLLTAAATIAVFLKTGLHRAPVWVGWVGYAVIPSPNFNERPPGEVVDCIVLHATEQPLFVDTIKRFKNPETKVSAHFVVDRNGTVVQMVPLTKRAWHAGVSELAGVPGVNDYSIGIEMTNLNDGKDPYPDAQYRAVAQIIERIREHYIIPNDRIISHAEVALPPGRKVDPKGFDFKKLFKMLPSFSS